MVQMQAIENQLQQIGSPVRYWGRAELRELQHILMENERIKFCLNGRYSGGFALICVTDRRILLVDRKLLYLTLEDIRYDMISEVDYNYRLLDATVSIFTPNKTLKFTCYRKKDLRNLATFIQSHIMSVRQPEQQQPQTAPAQQPQLQTYQLPQQPKTAPQQYYAAADDSNDVTIQSVKTFVPRLPLQRRVSNLYTNAPLSIKRNPHS